MTNIKNRIKILSRNSKKIESYSKVNYTEQLWSDSDGNREPRIYCGD